MGITTWWRYKNRHFNSLIINGDEASDRVKEVCVKCRKGGYPLDGYPPL